MGRRLALSLCSSVALHGLFAGTVVGLGLAVGLPDGSIEVEIASVRLEDIKELPLGPPPAEMAAGESETRRKARPRPKTEMAVSEGTLKSEEKAEPELKKEVVRPGDLQGYGPEGSRLTVLLRLDRLRGTPYEVAVDDLLRTLPDRNGLLEGTGLDLYRDFEAVLIATPDPRDYTVTFLALRHRMSDAKVRAAIDRGGVVTARQISWRIEGGRPLAERKAKDPGRAERDDRVIILPEPGLVVVTPPVYAKLLLSPKSGKPADWSALLDKIAAEDGAMPEDAVVMLTGVDIFKPFDRPAEAETDAPSAFGLPLPKILTATLGAKPAPFIRVKADFAKESQAVRFEEGWPGLQYKVRTYPLVVLGGFSPLVGRITTEREGNTIRMSDTASELEATRILGLVTSQLRTRRR